MADAARPARATPLRRDAVLEAVAFAAERLLLSSDWRGVAPDVLACLGVAVDASRASIVENTAGPDGRAGSTIAHEWCAPGVPPTLADPTLAGQGGDGAFADWTAAMETGQAIIGPVRALPPADRESLARRQIRSIAYFPIRVDGGWWGWVGFDDHEQERDWATADLEGLRTAATILGAAIQRQRQEERLRVAEARYRSVVERIPAVTYFDVREADGVRMAFVSPQIEALLGYPAERFLADGESWFDLVHPDDHERVDAAARRAGAEGVEFDEEYRMLSAGNEWVWVHDTTTPVRDEQGEITHFQGFMIDISARKAAESRYREVVESIPAVTYIDEPTGLEGPDAAEVVFASPQIEAMLGYPPERFLEHRGFWFEIMHPDDLARLRAMHAFDVGDTEHFDQEYRMRHADGHWVWVHDTSTAVFQGGDTPAYFQGFMLDISERKEAEVRLRQAEERFRVLVEQMPAIVYTERVAPGTSRAEAVDYVSPQVEATLGYPAQAWLDDIDLWTRIVHPEDIAMVEASIEHANETGEPLSLDYRVLAADGRVVWLHEEAVLIRDPDRGPTHWQGFMLDVTQRREAEQELRRTQERLQALIDHIPAVVYLESADADPAKFYLSPQVRQMLGYTEEQWTWTPDFWIDHVHPDDRPGVRRTDASAVGARQPYSLEYRFLRADGTYVWLHDEAVFVQIDGREGFWQGFLFDVSSRKEAEERIASAERVYRATIEHLPAVVYREPPTSDRLAEDFYISPQIHDLIGCTAEEWCAGLPGFWRGRLHPEDRERVLALNVHADATREPFATDYRLRRKDGSYVWVHDEATFVSPGDGEGWWQGFLFDVTERMEAEIQLREAEEKFRTIVEHNPAVIYTQEFDEANPSISRTTYISPRQVDVLGYSVEESLADPTLWSRLVHPDDRDRVLSADLASNTGDRERFSLEYRMIARDGRIVWIQDDAQLVSTGGRPPFWQGFLLDITERKHAEEQLARALEVEREATRRLRALDEMKNTFLQAVSHDLRTPLAAILGLAITLERGDVHLEEADAKDLAGRIAGNARRLDRLVMNLLDLDRLARGIVTPKLQPVDVGALVRRVVAESELIADSRLRTEIEEVVQPVDGAKLERIVENLLANTARHTPAGSTVWVRVWQVEDGVIVAVEDDGPGVDPAIRDTIFEPFQQGPDAPQHSPGVGVGLTLVRRFAELHGGRAWVQERDGGGASFRVFLPSEPHPPVPQAFDREE